MRNEIDKQIKSTLLMMANSLSNSKPENLNKIVDNYTQRVKMIFAGLPENKESVKTLDELMILLSDQSTTIGNDIKEIKKSVESFTSFFSMPKHK